jgi:hypothetical protein
MPTDDFESRAATAARALAAAAWREGFIAAHNMERGHGFDFAHPVDRFLWEDIDAWNPHTGAGTVSRYEMDD